MHFRILLGGHYHLLCLKRHGVAVLVLLGVVLVLDKAAFHGAGALTVKDVPDQVGKALVGAGAGAFNALLLFARVICRLGVVGLIAAGKVSVLLYFARDDLGPLCRLGGVAQFSVGQVLHQLPALNGCGEDVRVLAHGHHMHLIGLGQVSKRQVVTANVIGPIFRVEKCIAAGVVVIGHVAVGRQVRLVQVDLVVVYAAALCLVLVDLNDLCITQVQQRILCLIFFQGIHCSVFSGRIILIGVRSKPTGRRCLIVAAQFAVSHLALDLVENALCGGAVFCERAKQLIIIPAGTGILVVAGVFIVVSLVVVGNAVYKVRLCASSLYKRFSVLAPFQRGVQQDAVRGLRLAVFLLRQGQMGIRCQIKVVDVVLVIVNIILFTVDLHMVLPAHVNRVPRLPINLLFLLRRNTLHHLISGIPVVRRFPLGGAGVVFAFLLGGFFQLLQVRSQLGIGHGIIVDHMSHYLDNLFPFRFAGIDQGLDHAVVIVLDDKLLTVILSFFTGFIQLRVERIFGFFLRAAGACNHVRLRLLDFHSQLLCPIIVACRVGLAIFSRVGNGTFGSIPFVLAFAEFSVKLSLDLILSQLPGGNGDDGHGAIVFGLFVGFGSSFIIRAIQLHPCIGRSVGFKISKVKRSIATVLAAAPLLLF